MTGNPGVLRHWIIAGPEIEKSHYRVQTTGLRNGMGLVPSASFSASSILEGS